MFREWHATCRVEYRYGGGDVLEGFGKHAKKNQAVANAADDLLTVRRQRFALSH